MNSTMGAHAMVGRSEEGLFRATDTMDDLARRLQERSKDTADLRQGVMTLRTAHQLDAARAMLAAMRSRATSCGSHHRADGRS